MSGEAAETYDGGTAEAFGDEEDTSEGEGFASFDDFDFGDEDEAIDPKKTVVNPKKAKEEQEKKNLGRKGDDLKVLDTVDDEEVGTSPAPKEDDTEDEEENEAKDQKKTEEKTPEKSEEQKAAEKSKGKKVYIKVGEETFGIGNDALVPVVIDGKKVEIPLQELRNEYSGKKYAEQQLNALSVEKQRIVQTQKQLEQSVNQYKTVAEKIHSIAGDVQQNPKEAFKIFLDAFGFDTYDLEERMFKQDLAELGTVLQMSEVERKAYFLEKKNGHLQSLAEKRKMSDAEKQKVNTYAAQVAQLRKSFGVNEAQYVEAHQELTSKGYKDADLSEQDIVEWAATKPHRASVQELLKPYEEDLSDDAYGELVWSLSQMLMKGEVNAETIGEQLQEVYGMPKIVKDLNEKFSPVGRKSQPSKQSANIKQKRQYESFEDFDDEE